MAFSLQEIKGDLKRGVAYTSHYDVEVGSSDVRFRAISVSAPGRSVAATPSGVYGAIQEVGYGTVFAPISMTVVCSPNHAERRFFSEWQDKIVGNHRTVLGNAPESSFNAGYYNDYVRTVDIRQFDDKGSPQRRITLREVYPRTIGELSYSYAEKDLLTFAVTLQYRYYTEV